MHASIVYQGVLTVSLLLIGCVFSDSHFCSFNHNETCGYRTNKKAVFRGTWDLRHDFGGIKDHTSGKGWFMYASYHFLISSRTLKMAQLVSPPFKNIGCVQFYYYRQASSRGNLNVLAQIDGQTSLVWSVETGSSGNTAGWKFASIPIAVKGNNSVTLKFQADVFMGLKADTAIDDVNVTDTSSCKLYPTQPKDRIFKEVQGSCHFDTTSCGYTNSNGSKIWRRNRFQTLTTSTGPIDDHTFKTGAYVYAESSGVKTGTKAQLVSPTLANVQCASFYYHMYGAHMGSLNVYERVQDTDHLVFHAVGNQGRKWQKGMVYLDHHSKNSQFTLVFESVRGDGYKGDIAIDDILTFNDCHRPTQTAATTVGPAPTFPPNTLGPSTGVRTPGSGPAQSPAPTTGFHTHSQTTGSFLWTTAWPTTRPPRIRPLRIRLVSGPSKYEGRVEVFYNGKWGTICDDSWGDEDAAVVCRMLGFPGADRAVRSYGGGSGTIWLDELHCTGKEKSISDCGHAGWGNNNCGHSEDAGVVCQTDFIDTPRNASCTFNLNMCGYTNGDRGVSEFDWTRKRGSTPSSDTGPSDDVSGGGYYMYIEVSSGLTGGRAKLISPILPSSTKCMTFYYHMKGSNIGMLNVYVQPTAPNSTLANMWTLSLQQGRQWLHGQVPLNVTNGQQFQVIFEGIRGNDYQGDIAIDSIVTFNTTCDVVPAKAKYTPDPNAQEGNVRLVGGGDPKEGRVEIYHQGQWGTICKDKWDIKDTNVVCRMLGFVRGRTVTAGFGQGTGPIWLDDVQCNGNEQSLLQCTKKSWGYHNCQHSKDVSIVCINGTSNWECDNHRILNQADRSAAYTIGGTRCDKNGGIYGIYPGEWHRFDGAAGQMMSEVCIPVKRCNTHAPGWLDGTHPSVEEGIVKRKACFHWSNNCCKWSTNIRVKNCSKFYVYEFVNTPVCQLRYCGSHTAAGPTPPPTPVPPKIKIRLADSRKKYAGRVEVYHNGQWGTVCDDDWDIDDAHVACRMLGYSRAFKAHFGGDFPGGSGKIWLDNLQCRGNENDLWSCRRNNYNNCGHSEDAGVTCWTNELYSCSFEEGLCGYALSSSGWRYKWSRQRADKYLTDITLGKKALNKCLSGWTSYNKSCYNFKHRVGRITWHDAKRRCLGMNAWLVDIRDKAEWQFVKSQRQAGVDQYSIGIHDVNNSNVWTYYDGSVIVNFTNIWAPGEPNNWNGNNEDCGAMDFRGDSGGRYNDIPCGRAYGFAGLPNSYVCKRRPSPVFGHYLVADLSKFGSIGSTTSFTTIQVVNVSCLSFYFNTNGTNIDNVRVLTQPLHGKPMLVWKLEGNFGKQWNKAQIPLSDMGSTAFKAKFQVIYNSGYGKILIDDVNFTSNALDSCTFMPKEAIPPSWKDAGSCNFDIDICNYTNVKPSAYRDELDWFRVTAQHLISTYRPSKDHTTSSGSYIVMGKPLAFGLGHIGRLVSPVISPNTKCVTFYWYFGLEEISDMELTVYVRPAYSSRMADEIALWKITTEDGVLWDQWIKGMVPVSQKKDFQIIFEGMYNGRYQQSLSLDDIMVSNKPCSIYPNSTTPPSVAPTATGVRLAGSPTNSAGRVEIFHKGRWGTVCGDKWTMDNAHVVCRQLGFSGALAAPCCGLFGKGSGRVWLSNVKCSNKLQEKSISQCSHNGWGNNQCSHHQDAAVICNSTRNDDREIKVRLAGGSTAMENMEGRVVVHYLGVWGTIDDNGWDILDATVVCRQLNYSGAVGAYLNSAFGSGSGPVWFSSVGCKGDESSIATCIDHSKMSSFKPNHNKDAGVECFDARLVGGSSPNEGRVEINYKGKWGTVCNKGWNMKSANVICRNLGYRRAKAISSFGKGQGDIRLSDVICTGYEVSIALCSYHGWNVHDCDHSQDVGVVCTNELPPKQVTPCTSEPCKNKGKCKDVKQSFSCQCSRNFTGETCQTFIGSSVVSVLLKGDIKKWDPQTFKKSIAEMLNKYCQDCIDKSVRSKRESEKKKAPQFSSNDIIIVEDPSKSSRSPPGYLYIEFVVVKKTNGKTILLKPSKIRQTMDKGAVDGIGGYPVVGSKQTVSPSNPPSPSKPQVQAQVQHGSSNSSSLALKIGFAVVLTMLIAVIATLAVMFFIRRRRPTDDSNTYVLKSFSKNKNADNEVLINEEDNHML